MSANSSPSRLSFSLEDLLKRGELDEALEARLTFPVAYDNDMTHVRGLLKLYFWLADCKLPSAASWTTFANQLTTTDDAVESLFELTRRMVLGDFWRRQLTGWKELVACLLAALHLCKDNKHLCAVERIMQAKKKENDDMRRAMWKRDFRKGEHEPLLEDMPRKDVCNESHWQLVGAWLENNSQFAWGSPLWELLDSLDSCLEHGSMSHWTLEEFKKLEIPPGFKSSAEHKEAARLQRAMDAEREDEFDLGDVVDDEPVWAEAEALLARKRKRAAAAGEDEVDFSAAACSAADRRLAGDDDDEEDEDDAHEDDSDDRCVRMRTVSRDELHRWGNQEQWNKLALMRSSIQNLIQVYAEQLQSMNYAGRELAPNLEQAWQDVKPDPEGVIAPAMFPSQSLANFLEAEDAKR